FLVILALLLVVPVGLKVISSFAGEFATAAAPVRFGILVTTLSVIFGPVAVLYFAGQYGVEISNLPEKTSQLFLYLRMLGTGNGLSPLLPLFFAGAGGLLWIACSLRRLQLLEELGTANQDNALFFHAKTGSLVGMANEKLERNIRELLERPHQFIM